MKLPQIAESASELKALMNREKEPLKRKRLHVLYVVASGVVKSRQEAAVVVGVGRNAVGRWLRVYETEGLSGLPEVTPPPGMEAAVKAADLEQLRTALAQPGGFGSYKEVQVWLAEECGIAMQYQATYKLVRHKLGAKLKVARPRHPQKTQRP